MAAAESATETVQITNAVLRTLAGESVEVVARSSGISVFSLETARNKFLAAGAKALAVEEPRSLDRRREIIRVAIQCFGEHGYKSTRLENIADILGMTRPALYYYFKSKEELLSAVIDDAAHEDRSHSFSNKLRPGEGIVEGIRERLKDRVKYFIGDRLAVNRLLQSERQSLPEHVVETLEQIRRTEVRALEGFLEIGNRSGDLNVESPIMTAMLILSLAGATTRWFDPKRARSDDIVEAIVALVMDGIVVRGGSKRKRPAPPRKRTQPKSAT